MAPWYDKAEGFIGVTGTKRRIHRPRRQLPAPARAALHELNLKRACDKLNIPCIPSRLAMLTKPLNGRPPATTAANAVVDAVTASNFSSSQVFHPRWRPAKLTLITGAMAREILVGTEAKPPVSRTSTRRRAPSSASTPGVVVVAASACESARLLLNSKSPLFPKGLANSSGTVGKYLRTPSAAAVEGYFPQLKEMAPHNHDGTGGMHMYMPWWKYDRQEEDFPRGYHIEFGGGRELPNVGMFQPLCATRKKATARTSKKRARQTYGTTIGFAGRGEMLPNPDTYCEIDPDVVDEWGIPVLRFHFKWSEARASPGQRHAGDVPRHRGNGWRHLPDESAHRWPACLRHRRRRQDHSRSRHRTHGRRSQDLRPQWLSARPTTSRMCS